MKEEALKLADELDALHQYVPSEAPKMIRRLVEELDNKAATDAAYVCSLYAKSKPLSDEEIKDIKEHLPPALSKPELLMLFARAIEKEHGIK